MIETLLSGLALGAVYTLVAVGFNLTWLTTHTVNFAQGAFIVAGMFLTVYCYDQDLPIPLTLLILAAAGVLVAALEFALAVRPILGRGDHGELVTTVGTLVVIQGVILLLVDDDIQRVSFFGHSPDLVDVGGGRVSVPELVLIVLAVLVAGGAHLWTRRTRAGLAALGLSEDNEAAMLLGVNTRRFSYLAFAASGALGFLVAPFVGPKTFAIVSLAALLSIKGFVVLAVGGVGSNLGALVGGLGIGCVELFVARELNATWQNPVVFLIFVTVMLVRPRGLFGEQRERVV
ncbi:MAG: putative branched-chain amino acid transporter permease protein [Nocardioidaceae bacterium]|nr:putative branched-chain amino acid transporter permease protein [Nocardioidaceae bacterium]